MSNDKTHDRKYYHAITYKRCETYLDALEFLEKTAPEMEDVERKVVTIGDGQVISEIEFSSMAELKETIQEEEEIERKKK